MQSKVQMNKKHVRSLAAHDELSGQRSESGKDDGGILPQEFLAYVAQIGIIEGHEGHIVVPPALRIECARIAAPYFSDKLRAPGSPLRRGGAKRAQMRPV